MRKKQTNLFAVEATPETKIIRKQAKLLDQQRKILGGVSLEALNLATIQVGIDKLDQGIKKLEEGLRLLKENAGLTPRVSSPLAAPPPQPIQPAIKNACVMCGREGVYQSKRARVPRGVQPPWYCQVHAAFVQAEDAEDRRAESVAPSMKSEAPAPVEAPPPPPAAPVTTPGLVSAMANLRGERV